MVELAEVKKVANPDELFYVEDAVTGVVPSKFVGEGKAWDRTGAYTASRCATSFY